MVFHEPIASTVYAFYYVARQNGTILNDPDVKEINIANLVLILYMNVLIASDLSAICIKPHLFYEESKKSACIALIN